MKLDRTRPYGTVYGPSDHAYEQDNKRFGHDENEIVDKDLPKKREPKPKADQLAAQLEE
jgi:hypothetical protein